MPFHKKKSLLIYLSKIHCTWIRWLFGRIDWSCWLLLQHMIHDLARMQLEIFYRNIDLFFSSVQSNGTREWWWSTHRTLDRFTIVHTVLKFICFSWGCGCGGHPFWLCIRHEVSPRWISGKKKINLLAHCWCTHCSHKNHPTERTNDMEETERALTIDWYLRYERRQRTEV